MARPKRVESTESARQRIEEAYWELLEEMPYSRITISKLSRKAAVNHNLIYYYYENIDDLAEKTFIKNVESGQPQMMISALLTNTVDVKMIMEDSLRQRAIHRMRLYMRDDSAYLNGIARGMIFSEWLKSIGVSENELLPEERIDLNFIINGVVATLGSKSFDEDMEKITGIAGRPLGRGIAETFMSIGKERRNA